MSKTKRVEIEIKPDDWVYCEERWYLTLKLSSNSKELFCKMPAENSMTLSFEIPVPERKREFAEGEIPKAYGSFIRDEDPKWKYKNTEQFIRYLEEKYFGSESE